MVGVETMEEMASQGELVKREKLGFAVKLGSKGKLVVKEKRG